MTKHLAALLVGFLLPSVVSAATDVSGKWSGFPIYLTLKQDGDKVTGTAGQTEDDQIPFQTGSIEDDRLTLHFGSAEIDLTVRGDEMTGEVHQDTRVTKLVFRRMKPRDASEPPLAFDAASVKRSAPPAGLGNGSYMKADPGRLTCTNVPLKQYIVSAWGLKTYQVSARTG